MNPLPEDMENTLTGSQSSHASLRDVHSINPTQLMARIESYEGREKKGISDVRRTFCLFVTFDLLFVTLLWIIELNVSGFFCFLFLFFLSIIQIVSREAPSPPKKEFSYHFCPILVNSILFQMRQHRTSPADLELSCFVLLLFKRNLVSLKFTLSTIMKVELMLSKRSWQTIV